MQAPLPPDLACLVGALHAALPDRVGLLRDSIAALLLEHGRSQSLAHLTRVANRFVKQVGLQLDLRAGERVLRWLEIPGHSLLLHALPHYPDRLAAIAGPPPLLFVAGQIHHLYAPQLAVVGSRRATVAGCQIAKSLAAELAEAGLIVTSGLASGIDAAAHRGALDVGGGTVAVFGSGIDNIYPTSHRGLAEEVEKSGALVSEFPLGCRPARHSFPRRNRIISGLTLGTLVVEAAMGSGSLITAREALEQGREVFAVPGSILNPLSAGPHWLLRQGAALVASAADVLAELPADAGLCLKKNLIKTERNNLSPQALRVLAACGFESTSFDFLVLRSGLTPPEVSSILLALEIQGWVRAEPGGTFILLKPAPEPA